MLLRQVEVFVHHGEIPTRSPPLGFLDPADHRLSVAQVGVGDDGDIDHAQAGVAHRA